MSQRDVLALLELEGDAFAERVFTRAAVTTRSLDLFPATLERTLQGRTQRTEDQLSSRPSHLVERLGVDPAQIGTVVTASLYSLGGPTLAHRLVEHFRMDPATDKYHVVGVGCASAVPLVRLVVSSLDNHPADERADRRRREHERLADARHPGRSAREDGRIGDLRRWLRRGRDREGNDRPRGRGLEGASDRGDARRGPDGALRRGQLPAPRSRSSRHRRRPPPGARRRSSWNRSALTRGEIDHWIVHPGGRRILDCVRAALALSRAQLQISYDVLAARGNVGTASIFYVLSETTKRRRPRPGERGLMVTVGPGVTIGLMLLVF